MSRCHYEVERGTGPISTRGPAAIYSLAPRPASLSLSLTVPEGVPPQLLTVTLSVQSLVSCRQTVDMAPKSAPFLLALLQAWQAAARPQQATASNCS